MIENFRKMKSIYNFSVGVKINSMILTPDDKTLLITSFGDIKVWNLVDNKCIYSFSQAHRGNINLVLSKISMTFYSAGDDGLIKKWSLRDGKLKETFSRTPQGDPEAAGPKIFFIDFAVNESQLITGYSDGRIVVWNTKKKRIISTIEDNHRAAISLIVMSRDKSKVYTVSNSEDKSLKVWGYHKKRLILAIKNIHTATTKVLLLTKDDRYVITGSSDKSIAVWDCRRKALYHRFSDAHTETLTTIASSSDSGYLISGSTDSCIKIWGLERKECVAFFARAHSSRIQRFFKGLGALSSLVMTSGNKKMISSTWDKIKIWSSGENEDSQKAAVEANDRSCRIENCSVF